MTIWTFAVHSVDSWHGVPDRRKGVAVPIFFMTVTSHCYPHNTHTANSIRRQCQNAKYMALSESGSSFTLRKHSKLFNTKTGTKWSPFCQNIFKCIFLKESCYFDKEQYLKFVGIGLNDNEWTLVHVISWCPPGAPFNDIPAHSNGTGQMFLEDKIHSFKYTYILRWTHSTTSKQSDTTTVSCCESSS